MPLDTLDRWNKGPELPKPIDDASCVEYKNNLLLIGGYDGSKRNEILSLDAENPNEWKVREEKLQTARDEFSAVLVSTDEVNRDRIKCMFNFVLAGHKDSSRPNEKIIKKQARQTFA